MYDVFENKMQIIDQLEENQLGETYNVHLYFIGNEIRNNYTHREQITSKG